MRQADAVRRVLELCECREMMDAGLPLEMSSDSAEVEDRIFSRSSPAQLRAMLDEAVMLIRGLARYCTEEGETLMDPIRQIVEDSIDRYDRGWDFPAEEDGADDYDHGY